ncbi:hypothetical protein ABMA28_015328 [Loxostege sticticalis]|uniref:Endonuclease/exonuclease/phosphatase domain-containing protein n=1 Tax=Loxostege sticticalis TaxID=481309 RepID=A0ABD0TBG8_LOXSC
MACYAVPTLAPNSLTVIQTNLQHKQIAAATLRRVLEGDNKTVALIQEPWIRNNKICGLNNISGKLLLQTPVEKPRTCIVMPKTINASLINQFCSRDLTAVKINSAEDQTTLVLASVYMPGEDDIPAKELAELIQHCEANKWDVIIAADCNAHHPLWGSMDTNKRGEQLTEYLLQTNLTILNRGTEPTFVTSRCQTTIDITLATHKAADLVGGWHVSNEPSFADHRRICFQIHIKPPDPIPYRNPRKTDTKIYEHILTKKLSDFEPADVTLSVDNIESNVQSLTAALTSSYEKACPTAGLLEASSHSNPPG